MIMDSLLKGFGTILGVELVLTISNVVTSYVLSDGATMEEYLDSTAICLVEWPGKAMELIDHGMKIQIKKIDVNSRKISTFNF